MSGTEKPLFIRLSLPNGLEEALEGLAKEVLRSKPKNIYQFAAEHFEGLLKKRNLGKITNKEIKWVLKRLPIVTTAPKFEPLNFSRKR